MKMTRTMPSRFGWVAVLVLMMSLMTGRVGATSSNTDVSDIWWNPAESGWGMQLVNTGTFVFATVYVYGTNGLPTWFTAQLNRTAAGQITFTGPLYVNTGPYYGAPYASAPVTSRQAGTMTFVLTSVDTGQLSYVVDGVPVTKTVQRQTLTLDNYTGAYDAIITQTVSGCFNAADNGTETLPGTVSIAQNGSSIVVTSAFSGGTCTSTGIYSQAGRMGTVQGTYTCTWSEVGTITIFEMNIVPYMFTARLNAHSPNFGCSTAAEMVGVIPR